LSLLLYYDFLNSKYIYFNLLLIKLIYTIYILLIFDIYLYKYIFFVNWYFIFIFRESKEVNGIANVEVHSESDISNTNR
jgi:hypothetical protein